MNEIGLDPGIDHMLAVDCFDEVHSRGGKVRQCISCYHVAAPENTLSNDALVLLTHLPNCLLCILVI